MARSARKHRIGNAHMVAALTNGSAEVIENRPDGALVRATDDRGVILEIGYRAATEDHDLRIIYHCKPIYKENRRSR